MLEWHWRGVQDEIDQSFDPALETLREIGKTHDFCVTGDVSRCSTVARTEMSIPHARWTCLCNSSLAVPSTGY